MESVLSRGTRMPFVLPICLCLFGSDARATLYQDVVSASGIDQGLFVHLGASDGAVEIEAAQSGTFLVHALAVSIADLQSARAAIMARNLYGLASVEKALAWDTLTYGENLVNLLVADLDALSAKGLTEAEILRVLVPSGAAYVKKSGSWTLVIKPWNDRLGSWTHLNANSEGTNVGDDRLVRPPTTYKWLNGDQFPSATSTATGIRAAKGRVYYEFDRRRETQVPRGKENTMLCRDGFNGVLLWKAEDRPLMVDTWEKYRYATNGDVLVYFPDSGYAAALDARTGVEIRRYTEGLRLEARPAPTHCGDRTVQQQEHVICGNMLVQTGFSKMVGLDLNTGAKLWEYTEPSGMLLGRPVASEKEGKVFCTVGDMAMNGARWPIADVKDLIAVEMASGTESWRTSVDRTFGWIATNHIVPDTQLINHTRAGQLAYYDGLLVMFGAEPLNNCAQPWLIHMGAFNAADGATVWRRLFNSPPLYNMTVRNDTLFGHSYKDMWAWNVRTGGMADSSLDIGKFLDGTLVYRPKMPYYRLGYNGGCRRAHATPDYFTMGYLTMVGRDRNWSFTPARAQCDNGGVPAHGMVYVTSTLCKCDIYMSCFQALKHERHRPLTDDSKRLFASSDLPVKTILSQQFSSSSVVVRDWDSTLQNAQFYSEILCTRDGSAPAGLRVEPLPLTTTVGSKTIASEIQEHRVECRDGGALVWSCIADGRVSHAPVVYNNDLVIFGDHAGFVHAVKLSDGTPVWKFMAAASDKKMVAWGQVESCWPVFGLTLSGSTMSVSAGRHPAFDGGIYVYGINAVDGAIQWTKRAYSPTRQYPAGSYGKPARNPFLNADDVAKLGIDLSSSQDEVISINNASGGTPLADLPPVTIEWPYTGKSRARNASAMLSIRLAWIPTL